uniref:Uncharacterized protein n=1 Tax=Clastoptera arizonana TaxID=38151 RepID=A0A1B6E603_9HEMI
MDDQKQSGIGPSIIPDVQTDTELSNIETLKERLEQQKATKIKAEQIVSTLAKIKARERASRRSVKNTTEKSNDDSISTIKKPTPQSNAQKEKSNLLKQKLEEDRAKFESQKGHEGLGRVSEIVENLMVQLEDGDKTIQQIHSNLVSTPKHVPLQHVDSQLNEPELPEEVKQRISNLEAKILDLQENLKEKDSVISARTQAITLLSEDMARKGKNTLDTLEETRSQMREMQSNFSTLEERMNQERTRLKEELEDKKIKHQQAEKNFRAAENARFTLSTRVAELQEKIVTVQTKNISLEEELVKTNDNLKEMKEALDASNKQTITLKAQFKAKLKALEKERDALKKEGKENTELNQLKERIADLEDEKETAKLLKERIEEMEEKLIRQENDLDNHLKAISLLETEKLNLIQGEMEMSALLKQREELIESLKHTISELEERKVSAEIKCVDLEEKLDSFIKERDDTEVLQIELKKSQDLLAEKQAMISEITQKLDERQKSVESISTSDKLVKDLESDLQEWKFKCETIELQSEEWESKFNNLLQENQQLVGDCNRLKITCQELENVLTNSKIENSANTSLQTELELKESEIRSFVEQQKNQDAEISNLRVMLESTEKELQRVTTTLENLDDTKIKLLELASNLEFKEKELQETTDKLNKVSKKLSEYKKFHKLKSEDVLKISQELESVSASSQEKILDLEQQLANAKQIEEDLRKQVEEVHVFDGVKKISMSQFKKLAASLKLKTKALKDYDEKLLKLESLLEEKEKNIRELETDKVKLTNILEEKKLEENNFPSSSCKTSKEPLKDSEGVEVTTDVSELLEKMKILENTNAQLQEDLKANDILIEQLHEDLIEARSMNNTLITQFDNMQQSYKDEEVKTKSILDQFGSEMSGNKMEVDNLVDQLTESSRRNDQAWAKLQEKDAYIENLEQELEKAKSKMLHIQAALNERQEQFEMTTEKLGSRLQEAEIANETSIQYEGELENKIAHLVATEVNLKAKLEDLKLNNNDLQKTIIEIREVNQNLLIELNDEKNKVKDLRKELEEVNEQISIAKNTSDQVDSLKRELKECRTNFENQIKILEEKDKINSDNFEAEIQRLTDHIKVIESERYSLGERLECLYSEKRYLMEEVQRLTDVVNNENKLYGDRLEQVKIDFERDQNNYKEQSLMEINKILEEHKIHVENLKTNFLKNKESDYINIQKIESTNKNLEKELEMERQKSAQIEEILSSNQQEILILQDLLCKERTENNDLRMELVTSKAEKQVQDVVSVAEEKVTAMNYSESGAINLFKWKDEGSAVKNDLFINPEEIKNQPQTSNDDCEKILELESKMAHMASERETLKKIIKDLEEKVNIKIGTEAEAEEWPSKEEEDGWGFNDAMLEAEHIQKQKTNSHIIESRIHELEAKLLEYEKDRTRLTEELKVSNIKCGKLMKKAKEFKAKIDQIEKTKSVGFDDLDFAMQQELRVQIDGLEKSLKETKLEVNSLKIEREGFLKRIDTLTSANEVLVDMKERQDIEIEMWKKRSNDLANQIQALEWKLEEVKSEQVVKDGEVTDKERQRFIQNNLELEEKLNSVATENEYLLSVLGDTRNQLKKQESTVQLNERIDDLINENEKLNDEIEILKKKSSDNNELLRLQNENHKFNCTLENLNRILSSDCNKLFDESFDLLKKVEIVVNENKSLSVLINNLNCNIAQYQSKIDSISILEKQLFELKDEKEVLNSVIRDLNNQLDAERMVGAGGELHSSSYKVDNDYLKAENIGLSKEVQVLTSDLQNQASVIKNLQGQLSLVATELEEIKSKPATIETIGTEPVLFRGFSDTSTNKSVGLEKDEEIQSLKKQISGLNHILEEKENELETMKQYVECSNVGKENLRDEFKDTVKQIYDKQTAVHNFDVKDMENLKENLNSLHSLLNSKEQELEALNQLVKEMNLEKESKIDGMKQYVERLVVEKECLQNELQKMQFEYENTYNLDGESVTSLREKQKELHLLLESKNNELDILIEKQKELYLLLESKDNELDSLKVTLEQVTSNKDLMQEELMKKIEEIKIEQSNSLEVAQFHGFTVGSEVLSKDNTQHVEQVALLSKLLEEKDKEIKELKLQVSTSNVNIADILSKDHACKDLPAFRGFSGTSGSDFLSVNSQNIDFVSKGYLTEAQNESAFSTEKILIESNSLKQEEEKINKYRNEIQVLRDENALLNKLLQEKETELELMKQQIECSKVGEENLQEEIANRMLEIETKTSVQDVEEDQQKSTEEVLNVLKEEILELKHLLQYKDSNIELLTQKNQQTSLENEEIVRLLNEEIEKYKSKYKIETNELEKVKFEFENLKIKVFNDFEGKHQTELFELQKELSNRDQTLMNCMNDLNNLKNDYEAIKVMLSFVEEEVEAYKNENSLLKIELNNINLEHDKKLEVLHGNSEKDKKELLNTIESLKLNLNKMESDFNDLLSEKQKIMLSFEEKLEECRTLQEELRLEKVRVTSLNDDLLKLRISEDELLNDLKMQLKSKEAEIENLKYDNENKMSSSSNEEISKFEEMIRLRDVDIERLTFTLKALHERLNRQEVGIRLNSGEDNQQSRLDEALYTLHLRDVRCDELTLELMQLLEERDTLQLRLSTAIRINEELKRAQNQPNDVISGTHESSSDPVKHNDAEQLNEKLGQLHDIGYRKDPGVQLDREKRHNEQMHLYAHHSNQQDAPGFFNWIFGGSSSSNSQDV